MSVYTIDTTPSTPSQGVSLQDLGIRENVPKWSDSPTNTILTTGYDLTASGLTITDLQASRDLEFALDNGYIVLYQNSIQTQTVTSVLNESLPEIQTLFEESKEPTGIVDRTESQMSFVDGTRTFSIQPVSGSFRYYFRGALKNCSTTLTEVLPNVTGLYFIFIDETDALDSILGFDLSAIRDKILIATAYYNATTGKCEFLSDERHGLVLDWATHLHLHNSLGTRYYQGFGISFTTLTGDGSDNNENQIGLANGKIADEDIIVDITHSSSPTEDFEQVLSSTAQIPVMYKLGSGSGEWKRDSATNYPVKTVSSIAQYNSNSGAWALSDVTDGNFIAMWIVAIPVLGSPILAIMGSRQDSSLNDAKINNSYNTVDFGQLPSNEHKVLYRLIFECDSSFTNDSRASLRHIQDLRVSLDSSLATNVQTSITSHNELLDLTVGDPHTQYLNTSRGDARYYTKTQSDSNFQPLDSTLSSLASFNSNGVLVQTSPDNFVSRSIVQSSSKISVSNGDGVSGNPSIDVNEGSLNIDNMTTGISGILKGDSGSVALAQAGTDFVEPNGVIVSGTATKISYDSKGLVTAGTAATTADINDSTDRRYVTDAQQTVISNTSGVNTGNQTISLTGDVTGSGTGTFAATIANNAVSNAKFRQGVARSVVGVTGNAIADVADIQGTANQVLRVNATGTALAFGSIDVSSSSAVTGILQAASMPALTGDVTNTSGSLATTISNNAVNDAKISSHVSTKISITNKGQLNSSIVYNDQSNTFGDFNQIVRSSRLLITNPADSFNYTIAGSAITAGRQLTLPLTTQTETIAVVPQITESSPGNPTGTNSNVGVMMGLAIAFTPRVTGRIKVTIDGLYAATNAGSQVAIGLRFGTGGSPVNGAALTGTLVTPEPNYLIAVSNEPMSFAYSRVIESLVVGTPIWIDINVRRGGTNSTVTVTSLNIIIEEK
jgi:hypothetical protein